MASALRQVVFLRVSTALLWAVLAACVVYWALQLGRRVSSAVTAPTASIELSGPDARAVARVLGGGALEAAPVAASIQASRFVLSGVIDAGGRRGVALIAIDGKPARPFRVGSAVESGLVVQRVEARRAHLGADSQSATALSLELPAPRRPDGAAGAAGVQPPVPAPGIQGRFDSGSVRPEAGALPAAMAPTSPSGPRP